jgi:hypothetical protein
MSEKTKAILGTVVSVLVTVLAVASEWQDMGPKFVTWSLRAVAILTVLSNVLGLKVVSLRRDPGKVAGAGAIILGVLLIGIAASGCVSAGVKLAHGGMVATNTTAQALADAHKVYGDKVCPHVKRFRKGARPGMRLAVAGAVAAVKGKGDVMGALMPGLCELARLVEVAGPELGDAGKKLAAGLKPFGALVCPKSKSAAAVLAVILPVATAVIKWVMDLVGKPDKERLAEVAAWLRAPPRDTTDKICLE